MKYYAISGTWRYTNQEVEKDVREAVREIMKRGDGIVTGAAYGVDSFAIDEALKVDPSGKNIQSCIPVNADLYIELFYKNRFEEGDMTESQYEEMTELLNKLVFANPKAIISDENNIDQEISRRTHFECNNKIIELCDELLAFQVNDSEGTQDAIDKAKKLGKPVTVKKYSINVN